MAYRIQNLIATEKDPWRRGRRNTKRPPVSGSRVKRVSIGGRKLGPGARMTCTDATYEAYKSEIERYIEWGVVEVRKVNDPVGLYKPAVEEVAVPPAVEEFVEEVKEHLAEISDDVVVADTQVKIVEVPNNHITIDFEVVAPPVVEAEAPVVSDLLEAAPVEEKPKKKARKNRTKKKKVKDEDTE